MRLTGHPFYGLVLARETIEEDEFWRALEARISSKRASARSWHATLEMKLFEKVGGWGWDARIAVVLDVVERDRVAKALRSFFRPL